MIPLVKNQLNALLDTGKVLNLRTVDLKLNTKVVYETTVVIVDENDGQHYIATFEGTPDVVVFRPLKVDKRAS